MSRKKLHSYLQGARCRPDSHARRWHEKPRVQAASLRNLEMQCWHECAGHAVYAPVLGAIPQLGAIAVVALTPCATVIVSIVWKEGGATQDPRHTEGDLSVQDTPDMHPNPDSNLKPTSMQDTPEMYPATVDEWAEPLEGDDAEVAVIRPLLAGTNLREARLRQPIPPPALSVKKLCWSPCSLRLLGIGEETSRPDDLLWTL